MSLSTKYCLTNQTPIKLYQLSHQHPKIRPEPAVAQFQLFSKEVKLSLYIFDHSLFFLFVVSMMRPRSSLLKHESIFSLIPLSFPSKLFRNFGVLSQVCIVASVKSLHLNILHFHAVHSFTHPACKSSLQLKCIKSQSVRSNSVLWNSKQQCSMKRRQIVGGGGACFV